MFFLVYSYEIKTDIYLSNPFLSDTTHNTGHSAVTDPIQSAMSDINAEFREREVQQHARDLGMSYIDVSILPINDDLLRIVSEEESLSTEMIPFFQVGKKLRIAIVDPENKVLQRKIEKLKDDGFTVNINICSPEKLKISQQAYARIKKQNTAASALENTEIENIEDITKGIGDLVNIPEKFEEIQSDLALAILNRKAISLNASDIHFEYTKKGVRVRGRVDGMLKDFFVLSHQIAKGIVRQIKFNSQILANVKDVPQDGQFTFQLQDREIMVRVSVLPEKDGESIVMRYLDPQKQDLKISALGFLPEHITKIENFLTQRDGFIVVTGPTGSGKTTTLYSLIKQINTSEKKIITLEDPVEYTLDGIVQSSINTEKGYSFESGLKACLRQDPDVILVGEIRDFNTAETALQASLTGHLVFSTLHTNSAIETITRMKDLQVPSYLIANSLRGIIAQRLMRKTCNHCAQERELKDEEKTHLMNILKPYLQSGKTLPKFSGKIREGQGCKKCGESGYSGRTVINEIIEISEDLTQMIAENKTSSEIKSFLDQQNQTFLSYDAAIKILQGVTDYKEAVRVLGSTFMNQ